MEMHNSYTDGVPANPVNAVETVVMTLPAITVPAQTLVVIEGMYDLTTGATTTAVVVRCRRGAAVGGALVGTAITHTIGAAVSGSIAFQFSDTPGEVSGQQYVITATQTGGTSNGVSIFGSLQATWLS